MEQGSRTVFSTKPRDWLRTDQNVSEMTYFVSGGM